MLDFCVTGLYIATMTKQGRKRLRKCFWVSAFRTSNERLYAHIRRHGNMSRWKERACLERMIRDKANERKQQNS